MKKQYTKKQIIEAIAYWKKQLTLGNYKKLDEGWGPRPQTTSKKYSKDGFDFIVTVTTGKRRPRHGEGSSWIPFKSRRVILVNDKTGKFSGRLYNDFGKIVLEPDFDGWDAKYWARQAGIPIERLPALLDAAEEVLQQSKADF